MRLALPRLYWPLMAFIALDLIIKLHQASLLSMKLDRYVGTAILNGLVRDLCLVSLAHVVFLLWPGKGSSALLQLVLLLSALLVTLDAFYFYYSFTHVEPLIFEKYSPLYSSSAVKGFLVDFRVLPRLSFAVGCLGFLCLLHLGVKHRAAARDRASFLAPLLFFMTLALCGTSLTLGGRTWQPRPPPGELNRHLERTRRNYRELLAVSPVLNFIHAFAVAGDDKQDEGARFVEYTESEMAQLRSFGLLREAAPTALDRHYERVVFIVFESLHRDFLSFYNKSLPGQVSPFLDELLGQYPHLNNWYTSAMPTTYGINAMLLSKIMLRFPSRDYAPESLLSVVKRQLGGGDLVRQGRERSLQRRRDPLPQTVPDGRIPRSRGPGKEVQRGLRLGLPR